MGAMTLGSLIENDSFEQKAGPPRRLIPPLTGMPCIAACGSPKGVRALLP